MEKFINLFQTYRQAVWRTQRQWIGLVLILVVAVVMVAGIYLSVTANTALAGRSIQSIREQIAVQERKNADLESEYASLTSTEVMAERASELDFVPAKPEDLTFILIPGYTSKPDFRPTSSGYVSPVSLLRPEFTESLLDWFGRTLVSSPLDGVQR